MIVCFILLKLYVFISHKLFYLMLKYTRSFKIYTYTCRSYYFNTPSRLSYLRSVSCCWSGAFEQSFSFDILFEIRCVEYLIYVSVCTFFWMNELSLFTSPLFWNWNFLYVLHSYVVHPVVTYAVSNGLFFFARSYLVLYVFKDFLR